MVGIMGEEKEGADLMATKICPLQQRNANIAPIDTHCKEAKCAWWNRSYKMCNVTIEGYIAGVKWSASE